MSYPAVQALILAGGLGTRMKSAVPKVLDSVQAVSNVDYCL